MSIWTLAYHVPMLVCVVGLAIGIVTLVRHRALSATGLAWCALSILPLVATPHARTRADLLHQVPLLLAAMPLTAALWYGVWRRGRWLRAAAAVAVPFILLAFVPIEAAGRLTAQRPESSSDHGLARAWGVRLATDQSAAVRAVQRMTAPEDYLYVGTGRHDRLYANDALFYFLAGRRYATAYHNLLPGLATRDDVQRRIVADLGRRGTRCVVLATMFDELREAGTELRPPGSRVLDEWIRQTYTLSERVGGYEIWTRR